jgi:hypothetical protein
VITPFIFIDGNTIYSYDGSYIQITQEDIKNYKENNFSIEEVKSMAYSYLTTIPLYHFEYETNQPNKL